jgi:murein DD-endopeptidase MepM/ murein hydrolase activator NlpD
MMSQAPGGMTTTHWTKESRHAIDFAMPVGTPVVAAREGVVIAAEWRHEAGGKRLEFWSKGNAVRVRHPDGTIGNYVHLMHAGVAVEVGEPVQAGRILGYSGSTGFSSGPHLHFAVTRVASSQDGFEEISEPITFYVGKPPRPFRPRAGLAVTADYASPVEVSPPERAPGRSGALAGRALGPDELAKLWARLGALCALLVLGIAWFYRFSRN